MATRTPLYLDFTSGEVKELDETDSIDLNPTKITGDFTGEGGKFLMASLTEDSLEFSDAPGGSGLAQYQVRRLIRR